VDFNENALRFSAMRLNYSKLSMVKNCPFRFNKQYLEKTAATNEVEGSAAQIGIAVHAIMEKVFEDFNNQGQGVVHSDRIRTLMDGAYARTFSKIAMTTGEKDAVLGFESMVENMLMRLLDFAVKNKCKIFPELALAIDKDFNPMSFYVKEGIFFNGKIDLILVTPGGRVAIIDHKTGFMSPNGHTDQLRAYEVLVGFALAPVLKSQYGIEITSVQTGLNFIADEALVWSPKISIEDIRTTGRDRFVTWVNTLSDDIVSNEIRRGKHCNWCGYRGFCGSKVGMKAKKAAAASPVQI